MKKNINSDLIRGHINTIILSTLAEKDKYGYEIINEISKKSQGQYTLKQPTLYSALNRLETQGYIESYWGGQSGGGRRKYFKLTNAGREISEQNLSEWEYSRTVIDKLISEKDFDLKKPAPAPIDFNLLKQTTTKIANIDDTTIKNVIENKSDIHVVDERIMAQKKFQATRENKTKLSELFEKTIKKSSETFIIENKNDKPLEKENTTEKLEIVLENKTSGKIDFTDLYEMAENDGIKLKACRSNNIKKTNSKSLNKRKTALLASSLVFLTAIIELFLFFVFFKSKTTINIIEYIYVASFFAIVPILAFVLYIFKSNNDIITSIKNKSLTPMFILSLNLFLLICTISLVLNINLLKIENLLKYILLPLILLTNFPLYTIFYNFINKKNTI